jgi:hypothetical protein
LLRHLCFFFDFPHQHNIGIRFHERQFSQDSGIPVVVRSNPLRSRLPSPCRVSQCRLQYERKQTRLFHLVLGLRRRKPRASGSPHSKTFHS